jgi:hypothetical protein
MSSKRPSKNASNHTHSNALTDFHTSAKAMICFDSTIDDREAKEKMLTRFATQHSIPILMRPMVPLSEGKNLQMCNYLFILDCP